MSGTMVLIGVAAATIAWWPWSLPAVWALWWAWKTS